MGVEERVASALWEKGAYCGQCEWVENEGGEPCGECRVILTEYARALADAGCLAPEAESITRVTVVKYPGGRFVEDWNVRDVDLSIQDEGRTLKVFYWKEG